VQVARPAREHDRLLAGRGRRERCQPAQPAAYRLGRQVLLCHVAATGLPLQADLAHRRHQDLVDGPLERQDRQGAVQDVAHLLRVEAVGGREELVDELPRGAALGQQQPHGLGRIAGTPAPRDLVAHQPQLGHGRLGVAAVAAVAARRHRHAVAALPRPQGGCRDAEPAAGLVDGQSSLVRHLHSGPRRGQLAQEVGNVA
jgi:hypothetical protein